MTRITQASKNIKYSIIAYSVNVVLKFMVRWFFIKSLSLEYLGINGLFTNLLSMLSLIELGIGPAIVYSLYKPLAEKDIKAVKSLMTLLQKIYILVGAFIIIAGICIIPWLNWFIKSNTIVGIKYFYVIFLLNTGISYFYSYKRNLLIADQKQYINSSCQMGGQIVLALLQIFVLIFYPKYWLYILLMPLVTILENIIVSKKVDKFYPYIRSKDEMSLNSDIKECIIRNVKALFVHKIGAIAVFSTSNIILSKFVGLVAVGLYNNYYLIINTANSFVGQFITSITAGIGNLIVSENNEKKVKIFRVTEFMIAWQAMSISCSFYVLLNILIELWLGKQFLFDIFIVKWFIINFYIMYMRKAVLAFRDASGLYWNDRYKPLALTVINIVASVYLTIHYGVVGVIWGGIISTLLTCFWVEPYVLFRNSIEIKLKDYFKDYFKYAVVTLLTAFFSKWLYNQLFSEITIINFVLGVVLCLVVTNAVWILVFRKREEMVYLRNIARDKFGMKFL
ncbi:lipopolysaccharide biosynthesis protein [Phascolarctobacterium sp.]